VTVQLTGRDLTPADVLAVARGGAPVELADATVESMSKARGIVEVAAADETPVYGLTTGVGVLKRVGLTASEADAYSHRLIRHHLVAQGNAAPLDVVRAGMLRLANAFAGGTTGVRPRLAERLVEALNAGETPRIRVLGSVGQADLAAMADLAWGLFRDEPLSAGEGLALVSSNAFTTGWATLALADARVLLEALDVAGALALEGLAANPALLHRVIARTRPYPGIVATLDRLHDLLDGSALWDATGARNLQDPLTFRNLPHLHGAARDVLSHAEAQLTIELNASDSNPVVVADERRLVGVANFEALPVALALDSVRLALAPVLAASAERVVKLVETPFTGLPTGLVPSGGSSHPGLSYLAIAGQAIASEARLLAQPVAHELVSTAHAEGIEDRSTMAPLAARRLAEQVTLGARVAAIELTVAGQAAELRGRALGTGTHAAIQVIRAHVPFMTDDDEVPDVEPLVAAVRAGAIR
jgi:histidine ammonia-lyase